MIWPELDISKSENVGLQLMFCWFRCRSLVVPELFTEHFTPAMRIFSKLLNNLFFLQHSSKSCSYSCHLCMFFFLSLNFLLVCLGTAVICSQLINLHVIKVFKFHFTDLITNNFFDDILIWYVSVLPGAPMDEMHEIFFFFVTETAQGWPGMSMLCLKNHQLPSEVMKYD